MLPKDLTLLSQDIIFQIGVVFQTWQIERSKNLKLQIQVVKRPVKIRSVISVVGEIFS